MWLLTPRGFISIVKNRNGGGLVVRARSKSDLATLLKDAGVDERIATSLHTDYKYRAFLSRAQADRVILTATRRITYGNFKDEVARVQGKHRANIYADVWTTLREIQETE